MGKSFTFEQTDDVSLAQVGGGGEAGPALVTGGQTVPGALPLVAGEDAPHVAQVGPLTVLHQLVDDVSRLQVIRRGRRLPAAKD